jgi:hypothetical protein
MLNAWISVSSGYQLPKIHFLQGWKNVRFERLDQLANQNSGVANPLSRSIKVRAPSGYAWRYLPNSRFVKASTILKTL